jgi:hypothetical protein
LTIENIFDYPKDCFLAPIQSLTLRNKIISIEYKKDEPASAKFDQLYVVHLQRCLRLADPQPAFTFSHPNIAANSNERAISLDFTVAVDCEVTFSLYHENWHISLKFESNFNFPHI